MLLNLQEIKCFEEKYKVSVISFLYSKTNTTFECHLETDFGELPTIKTDMTKRPSQDFPYEAVAYISGIKFFYLINKEDC